MQLVTSSSLDCGNMALTANTCLIFITITVNCFTDASRSSATSSSSSPSLGVSWSRPALPDPQTASLSRLNEMPVVTLVERSPSNTSLMSEARSGFYALVQNEDALGAARDSLRAFIKSLRSNRSLDEALTIAITAFAASRTSREINHSMSKNAKFLLDKEHLGKCMCSFFFLHSI